MTYEPCYVYYADAVALCGSIKYKIKNAVNLKADYEYTHRSKLEPRRFVYYCHYSYRHVLCTDKQEIGASPYIINGTGTNFLYPFVIRNSKIMLSIIRDMKIKRKRMNTHTFHVLRSH